MSRHDRFAGLTLVRAWPDTATYRESAARFLAGEGSARDDLVGVRGALAGSGRHDGEFWECAGWFLKTRAPLSFSELHMATTAFERLQRIKEALGALRPVHTVLLITSSAAGHQVWTLAPRLETLREAMQRAHQSQDGVALGRAFAAYAHALGLSLEAAVDHGLSLDPSPANFASQGGRLRYIDDDVAARSDAVGLEDAFIARFGEYPGAPESVWNIFVTRFVDEMVVGEGRSRWARLGLEARLRAAAQLRRGTERWVEAVVDGMARAAPVGAG